MAEKTVREIAEHIGGKLIGDGTITISDIKAVDEAGAGDIAFVLHPRFSGLLEKTAASCVIVPAKTQSAARTIIQSENPSLAYTKVVDLLEKHSASHPRGIHKTAIIGKGVSLGKGCGIGPYCVIEDNVVLGDGVVLYPFSYIGRDTAIGASSVVYPNVSIRERITIGERVIIHSGSVIGSDGFGYENSTGTHVKIPQIGDVIIGDDVEIGACVTIDRAKIAHTRIGKGTKIDNLVQIAHNVTIGAL